MDTTVTLGTDPEAPVDLSAEDLALEALADSALLGTAGSFGTGACFSCPASSASSAGSFSSAG